MGHHEAALEQGVVDGGGIVPHQQQHPHALVGLPDQELPCRQTDMTLQIQPYTYCIQCAGLDVMQQPNALFCEEV